MFKTAYCLRKPGKTYDKLLVIDNVKMLFATREAAQEFAKQYYPDYYVDQEIAWDWQRVLDLSDVWFGNWSQGGRGNNEENHPPIRNRENPNQTTLWPGVTGL